MVYVYRKMNRGVKSDEGWDSISKAALSIMRVHGAEQDWKRGPARRISVSTANGGSDSSTRDLKVQQTLHENGDPIGSDRIGPKHSAPLLTVCHCWKRTHCWRYMEHAMARLKMAVQGSNKTDDV